jgi:hypothetical protein
LKIDYCELIKTAGIADHGMNTILGIDSQEFVGIFHINDIVIEGVLQDIAIIQIIFMT